MPASRSIWSVDDIWLTMKISAPCTFTLITRSAAAHLAQRYEYGLNTKDTKNTKKHFSKYESRLAARRLEELSSCAPCPRNYIAFPASDRQTANSSVRPVRYRVLMLTATAGFRTIDSTARDVLTSPARPTVLDHGNGDLSHHHRISRTSRSSRDDQRRAFTVDQQNALLAFVNGSKKASSARTAPRTRCMDGPTNGGRRVFTDHPWTQQGGLSRMPASGSRRVMVTLEEEF